jgi:hypothetical protein
MIHIETNLPQVMAKLISKISSVLPGSPVYRQTLAGTGDTLLRNIKNRIHEQGLASDGSVIGAHRGKEGYLVSTGALRDKLMAQQTQKGIGLSWPSSELYERAQKLEKRYGKKIWNSTEDEKQKLLSETEQQILKQLT